MSRSKRLSFSSIAPVGFGPESPLRSPPIQAIHQSAEEWRQWWDGVYAKDLIDLPVELVDGNTAVDEACDLLLSKGISCIAVRSEDGRGLHGLFDFADVNAFLTLAATQHTLSREELNENPRADRILTAARSGKVPVHLVSNLSDKNSMEVLPNNSTLLSLLAVFSRGTHRVLIRSDTGYAGFVTDGAALTHITSRGSGTDALPSLSRYLTNPLFALQLPSTQLYSGVVSVTSTETVLDAMRRMSEDGVSSVAVLDDGSGRLLSAVSVTDVGKIVLPTQSNHILTTEMSQMVTLIRSPLGSTDGVEHYPVYSIALDSSLSYMVQKLIATNSHRLFVTDSSPGSESPSVAALENLCGVVSIVDLLALFARIAQVPGVDPLQAQTRRRMSTSSSRSSRSGSSRSSSRSRTSTRVRVDSSGLSPSVGIGIPIPLSRSGASPASHSPSRGISGSPRVPR